MRCCSSPRPSPRGSFADEGGPALRLDAWRVIGPGAGGTMRRPAISPHDPKLVVEGCDMTGAYITRDGGESWRMFNLGAPPSAFAFDPRDPKVIYAATAALFRTEDGGHTWTMVYPDPLQNTRVHARTDHGDFVITTDDEAYLGGNGSDVDVHAVAVDPEDSGRLAMAASSAESPRPGSAQSPTWLLVSDDRGRTWTRVGPLETERAFAIDIDGTGDARTIRVAAESGVYESAAGVLQKLEPPAGGKLTSASFGRDGAARLVYATTAIEAGPKGGLYASEDGGRTWRAANDTLLQATTSFGRGESWGGARGSRPALGPVAASARRGRVAYVGLRGLQRTASGPKVNGIARTTDGGRTWTVVFEESEKAAANLEASWVEERAATDGHSVWFDAPYDLAVAPNDPDVCFATDLFRTYRTADGGRTWAQANSARRGEGWVSRGLDVTNSYGIHWDPFDARRVFISYTDMGLFRSEDDGESWTSSTVGVPLRWRNTTYWVDFDPEVPNLMWGAFSGTHDLPRPKMWRRRDPDTFEGGVGVSTDGGRTWKPSWTGMPESAITHVLVDPASPKGRRTLYAAGFGRGVFKSTDDGATWTLKNAGITEKQPFAWRLARAGDGTLYVVVARRSERGEIGDGRDGAVYRSTDGAEHWTRLTLPEGTNGPNGLAVDPKDLKRLYLAAWGRATPGGDTGGGIFLSTDGGATWKPVLTEYQHVYDVTIDPRDSSQSLRVGLRPVGPALRGPRPDLDAHPRVQLQVGPPRHSRSPRSRERLRHDVRRQRLARPGGGGRGRVGGRGAVREDAQRGAAPGSRPSRRARGGQRGRRPRLPGPARAEGEEGRSRLLARRRSVRRGPRGARRAPDVAPRLRSGRAPGLGGGPGVVFRSREGPEAARRRPACRCPTGFP